MAAGTLCWFPGEDEEAEWAGARAEPPLWLWQDTGLQQERLEGGTATELSYFPPPAEKFSQRLQRPQGSGRFLQGWGEEQAGCSGASAPVALQWCLSSSGSAVVPQLWLCTGQWGHPGALGPRIWAHVSPCGEGRVGNILLFPSRPAPGGVTPAVPWSLHAAAAQRGGRERDLPGRAETAPKAAATPLHQQPGQQEEQGQLQVTLFPHPH